jgi:CubicO group peptidase (beta-lactamase class C family)
MLQGMNTLANPQHHLPKGEDFLMWPPCLQSYGYRIVDKLFATRVVKRGDKVRDLPRGQELAASYVHKGDERSVDTFMDCNNVAGLLVIKNGQVVTERYGLGLQPQDRWSTMSMVKSVTAILVGAAVQDGVLTIDHPVVQYLPQLSGSGYKHVSVRQLMTMSSGVAWSEDYGSKQSDVNRYSKSLADKVPGGVLQLLQAVPAAHTPGTVWHYNTGDTYLLGAVISAATGCTLADYLSKKIWQPCGMEFDAFYTLESDDGQEIAGSRAGMALRDWGRFALFAMDQGLVDGQQVLPVGWMDSVATRAFTLPADFNPAMCKALGLTGYGFSWWLRDGGGMMAMGHAGQRLYINREEKLIVIHLAVYPEPRYVSASETDRDGELNSLIEAIRCEQDEKTLS